MKVYAIWHDDEIARLRGIYLRREDAWRDLPVEAWILSDRCMTVRHGVCCSVEEMDVRESALGVVALPERPQTFAPLVPLDVADAIVQNLGRKVERWEARNG